MSESHRDVLSALKAELQEATASIAQLHTRLAAQSLARPTGESELRVLWDRRDTIVSRIGAVVAEQILAGQRIDVGAGGRPTAASSVTDSPQPAVQVRRRIVRPAAPAEVPMARTRLAEFLEELGTPEPARSLDAYLETYERMRYVATHCNRWLDVPQRAQRHLVGAVVAWLRDLQESNDDFGRPLREPQLVGLISRLSHWSRENRPGWVNGLARGATPDGGSWRQDTLYHLEALQGQLTPARASSVDPLERLRHALEISSPDWSDQLATAIHAGMSQSDPALVELFVRRPELLAGTPYQTLLQRVYDRTGDEHGHASFEGETMDFVPIGWDWLGYTRGQHALLLGGDPSAPAAAALKEAFEFSKVTWDPADAKREGPIVRRIASGAVDLILFLKGQADASLEDPVDDASSDAEVPLVLVRDGHGVRSVRRAIEDELEPFSEDDMLLEEQPRA